MPISVVAPVFGNTVFNEVPERILTGRGNIGIPVGIGSGIEQIASQEPGIALSSLPASRHETPPPLTLLEKEGPGVAKPVILLLKIGDAILRLGYHVAEGGNLAVTLI
jgi:hypothetical protein